MELQIHTLQKQIEARLNEITELQQFWLRNQSELVKTLKDVQKQSEDMEYFKKQYTILLQKKLRIEGKQRSYRRCGLKDLLRLMTLLYSSLFLC